MRRNVEEDITSRLDSFLSKKASLPATVDGKVNVAALVRDLGLKASDSQYFFKIEAIKRAVNALAEDQGLAPIGARADLSAADKKILGRIAEQGRRAMEVEAGAVNNAALVNALTTELQAAQAEIIKLRRENATLRERLVLVDECGFLFEEASP